MVFCVGDEIHLFPMCWFSLMVFTACVCSRSGGVVSNCVGDGNTIFACWASLLALERHYILSCIFVGIGCDGWLGSGFG